ncbi:MAG TPA: hypothetical protein VK663_13450 [Burkholderiales bacterium]|nr:hypothetical protein [Burkholderiales bacterium]
MKLKSKIAAWVLSVASGVLIAPLSALVHAGDSTASVRASENLSAASGRIVSGSVGVLGASGELIVVGVEQSANGVSVVMKNAADVSGEVVTVLIDGASVASIATGPALQASATGVGHVLVASGQVIAFIPNEIGQSLLHQSRYSR